MERIHTIFDDEPVQWGHRGDPFLWNELKDQLRKEADPADATTLLQLLHRYFEAITLEPAIHGKIIFIERYRTDYNFGTHGLVSCDFWLDVGFPLLVDRWNALRGTNQ